MNVNDVVKAVVAPADDNPYMDSTAPMFHYRVTLKVGRRQMTVPFSTGTGWTTEPTAEDVVFCLLGDALWAESLGYDQDSPRAEKIYNTILKQSTRLRTLLGDLYDDVVEAWHNS